MKNAQDHDDSEPTKTTTAVTTRFWRRLLIGSSILLYAAIFVYSLVGREHASRISAATGAARAFTALGIVGPRIRKSTVYKAAWHRPCIYTRTEECGASPKRLAASAFALGGTPALFVEDLAAGCDVDGTMRCARVVLGWWGAKLPGTTPNLTGRVRGVGSARGGAGSPG